MSPHDPRAKACREAVVKAGAYVIRAQCFHAPDHSRGSYADLIRARMEARAALSDYDGVALDWGRL